MFDEIGLPENAPLWLASLLLILNFLKEPIGTLFSKTFPGMADKHFSNRARVQRDELNFKQTREMEILKSDLDKVRSERERSDYLYNQLLGREKTSFDIIEGQFKWMQSLVDERLEHGIADAIEEIIACQMKIEVLDRKIDRNNKESGLLKEPR